MQTSVYKSIGLLKLLRPSLPLLKLNDKYRNLNKLIWQYNCANTNLPKRCHYRFMSTGMTGHIDKTTAKLTEGVLTLEEIHQFLVQHNCRDIVFIELPNHVNYLPYFIVATANSYRHLNHTSENFNRLYKDKKKPSDPFTVIDGKGGNQTWHSIDVQNAVVHIMLEEARNKYQLEKLWVLGPDHDCLTSEQQHIQDDALYALIDFEKDQGVITKGDSVTFVNGQEITNPWEVEYDEEKRISEDFEEDEYIV